MHPCLKPLPTGNPSIVPLLLSNLAADCCSLGNTLCHLFSLSFCLNVVNMVSMTMVFASIQYSICSSILIVTVTEHCYDWVSTSETDLNFC